MSPWLRFAAWRFNRRQDRLRRSFWWPHQVGYHHQP